LINVISNIMIKNQNRLIELRKKVLFTILAKQKNYLAVGNRFELAKSTNQNIIKEIVTVLIQLPNYFIWENMQSLIYYK